MSRELEERIAALAARQHGVVTRGQLIEAGLSPWAVAHRLRSGRLRRLHGGVYLVGPLMPAHAREMAAVLASGPDAVVSHFSAASFRGIWMERMDAAEKSDAAPVHVAVVGANRGNRPGIRVHRVVRLDRDEWTIEDGIPVTTPERTLADLAGMVGSRELEGMLAKAEREGLVGRESLAALPARYRGRPGMPALRAILNHQDGPALTRSEAEERFLVLLRQAGLPSPETNVRIGPYEIDFFWRAEHIAVEVDGFRHHSLRPRFEGDRRKDAWLVAQGIQVVRLSWRQITQRAMATVVQVGQTLARAGREVG